MRIKRGNFPNNALDNFGDILEKVVYIIDRGVRQEIGVVLYLSKDEWYIPEIDLNI